MPKDMKVRLFFISMPTVTATLVIVLSTFQIEAENPGITGNAKGKSELIAIIERHYFGSKPQEVEWQISKVYATDPINLAQYIDQINALNIREEDKQTAIALERRNLENSARGGVVTFPVRLQFSDLNLAFCEIEEL